METILIENTGVEFNIDTANRPLEIGDELFYEDDKNATIKLVIIGRRWQRKNKLRIKYYGIVFLAKEVK